MKTRIVLCLLLLINTCLFTVDTPPEYKHEDRALNPLEKETFNILKKKFPGKLLDAKLKNLRALAESREYLTFLDKTYPKLAPFKDFEDFDSKVTPPKDRYLQFCQDYLNIETATEITDDEQFVIHHISTSSWASEASQRGKDKPPDLQSGKPYRLGPVIAFKPIGKEILKRRAAKSTAFTALLITAQSHLNEDIRWVKVLFEKHGKSDACRQIAVQYPMLFYRILYTFSTDTTFLKCLYDPVDVDAERRKRFDERYGTPTQREKETQ